MLRSLAARLLITLLVALAPIGAAQASAPLDHVSLRLNWLVYGFHTPFYLGVADGIYRRHGIDLSIRPGQGSGSTVQVVAAGGDTFGLADGGSLITVAAQGAKVISVMGVMNKSPYAITVRTGLGIRTFKDLAGKTIAGSPGEAPQVIFPALLSLYHMAPDAVHIVNIGGPAQIVAVLQKRVDGMFSGLDNQALILPSKGASVRTFGYADLGLNTQGLTIVVSRATLAKHPGLVRRFILATREAFAAANAHPNAAIAAGLKAFPALDPKLSLAQLKVGLSLMKSPHGPNQPIGWMSAADWTQTLALLKNYQGVKTSEPASSFWTNAYLPK